MDTPTSVNLTTGESEPNFVYSEEEIITDTDTCEMYRNTVLYYQNNKKDFLKILKSILKIEDIQQLN